MVEILRTTHLCFNSYKNIHFVHIHNVAYSMLPAVSNGLMEQLLVS